MGTPTTRARIGRRKWPLFALVAAAVALVSACLPVGPLGQSIPAGALDLVAGGNGAIHIVGWAANGPVGPYSEPPGPTNIVVNLDGDWVAPAFPTTVPRPDVEKAIHDVGVAQILEDVARNGRPTRLPNVFSLRQPGSVYGFDFEVAAGPGEHTVCVVALNADWGNFGGDHVLLGCRTVTVG